MKRLFYKIVDFINGLTSKYIYNHYKEYDSNYFDDVDDDFWGDDIEVLKVDDDK